MLDLGLSSDFGIKCPGTAHVATDTITFDGANYRMNGTAGGTSSGGMAINASTGVLTITTRLSGGVLTKIVCEGSDGYGGVAGAGGGVGGGGGACSIKTSVSASGSDTFTCSIGQPIDETQTQISNPSATIVCKAAAGKVNGTGGSSASGVGDTKYSGGNGGAGGSGGGGGGGSRASELAAGNNGSAGGASAGGAGGTAPLGGFVGGNGGSSGVTGLAAINDKGGTGGDGFASSPGDAPAYPRNYGEIRISYTFV